MNKKSKKMNREEIQKEIQTSLIHDEQNDLLHFAAMSSIEELFKKFHTSLCGLNEDDVKKSSDLYGTNVVDDDSKKTLNERLVDVFVNPFTLILFCLAIVSSITDMLFPYFEMFGNTKENFDCLTVVIISTMVLISGIMRFV